MCFRPPAAAKTAECPACGKKVSSVGGLLPKKCPYCHREFEETADG